MIIGFLVLVQYPRLKIDVVFSVFIKKFDACWIRLYVNSSPPIFIKKIGVGIMLRVIGSNIHKKTFIFILEKIADNNILA